MTEQTGVPMVALCWSMHWKLSAQQQTESHVTTVCKTCKQGWTVGECVGEPCCVMLRNTGNIATCLGHIAYEQRLGDRTGPSSRDQDASIHTLQVPAAATLLRHVYCMPSTGRS